MVEREIVISDGEISLAKMSTEDMENYFSLSREVSGIKDDSNGNIVMNTEKIWNSIVFGERVIYSILDEGMNFCGDIELQDVDSKTPGIGIEILEEKRNQGIGTKALILFLQIISAYLSYIMAYLVDIIVVL